jgi:hypothetical protein
MGRPRRPGGPETGSAPGGAPRGRGAGRGRDVAAVSATSPTPAEARDPEAIRQALAAGQLTVADPTTGYHRALYAPCPADGQPAAVWRVVKEHGGAITQLTMRCARCGGDFVAAPEALYLR